MRTLTKMRARVRRYISDALEEGCQWSDDVLDEYLEDAARTLWRDLLADERGRRCLRRFSAAADLMPDTELYDLPADCALLEGVEYRRLNTDRWIRLPRVRPPDGHIRSGNAVLFTPGSSAAAPSGWTDEDAPEGAVRIWPESSSPDGTYRFRYYAAPAFPTEEDGTFEDPNADGAPERELPSTVDMAVEHLAAGFASGEELADGRPIAYHGQRYNQVLAGLIQGTSGFTLPRRRFIRRVRR